MKILYVITGLGQGGAERVVCDLADKMYEKGSQVKIAYLVGEVLTRPSHQDIELVKVNLNSMGSLFSGYMKLLKLIKSYQPDVVHSHMVHANLLTRLIRLVSPMKKLISTAHSNNEGGQVRMFLYRMTHGLADVTTNVSRSAALAFEEKGAVPKNGIQTIYNGIDLNRFKYLEGSRRELNKELDIGEDCKVILAVGRFNEAKDYPNLLKAIQTLKIETTLIFKFLIVGDGELRGLLESTINELNLEEDVVLLGRRNDIPKLMSAADLFVLPSKYEGFGLVVAEAMACECLVVATNCGGVAEVLNLPDFLVPPSNPNALKDKIIYMLDLDKYTKKIITSENLEYIQNKFSLDFIANQWVDIYNEN